MHSEEEYYHKGDNLIRISCQALQSVFRERWKQSKGTEWTSDCAEEFNKGEGREAFKIQKGIQKRLMREGNLEEWDLNMLNDLLLRVKCLIPDDKELQERDKIALKELREARNGLAHNAQKKINGTQYQQIEDTVRQSLNSLGIIPEKVDKLISYAGVTSSVDGWEHAKKFQESGDGEVLKHNFDQAIKHYDDALQVPSLLPVNLCTLYEQRASCYLEMAKQENSETTKTEILETALTDINEALSHNENSWKARSILASIYKEKNELDKAVENFTRAFAICPAQTSLKIELDDCKLLQGIMKKEGHIDSPLIQPKSLEQYAQAFTGSLGLNISREESLEFVSQGDKFCPGIEDVVAGHKFANGWRVGQNHQEAARYYSKAMTKDNAEGIYHLALLYEDGKGVKKDPFYSSSLMERSAGMPEKVEILGAMRVDPGVQAAQHRLGLKDDENKDYKDAVKWYKKAADTGSGHAANNLAILYYKGSGVKKDFKKAEHYWKLSAERGNANAAYSLCIYHKNELEPENAVHWLDKAIQLGHPRLPFLRNKILERIEKVAKEAASHHATTQISVDVDEEFDENFVKLLNSNLFKNLMEGKYYVDNWSTIFGMGNLKFDRCIFEEILRRSKSGSVSAKQMLTVLEYNEQLAALWNTGPPFSEELSKSIIELAFLINSTEPHLFFYNSLKMQNDFKAFVMSKYENHSDDKGELDKKIRICHAKHVITEDQKLAVKILQEGIRRYPDEVTYYIFLHSLYLESDQDLTIEVRNRFLTNAELLWLQAKSVYSKLLGLDDSGNIDKETALPLVRTMYQTFTKMAAEDHPKMPEAYYCISQSYITKTMGDEEKEKVLTFFGKAQDAEFVQLPCYPPYESSIKDLVISFVNETDSSEESYASSSGENLQQTDTDTNRGYLTDPNYIEIRKDHRLELKQWNSSRLEYTTENPGPVQQKMPKNLIGLQEITLSEMDSNNDRFYEHKILNLTLIEDPILNAFTSIHLVGMDDKKNITRVRVYNVKHNQESGRKYAFGSRLSVLNPVMKMCDNKNVIIIDEPKCIIFMEKAQSMCRYCGQENAQKTCTKCKWAKYCSRDCQIPDWEELKHKLICKPVNTFGFL